MVASKYGQLDNTALDTTHLKFKRHFLSWHSILKTTMSDTVYSYAEGRNSTLGFLRPQICLWQTLLSPNERYQINSQQPRSHLRVSNRSLKFPNFLSETKSLNLCPVHRFKNTSRSMCIFFQNFDRKWSWT